MKKKSKNKKTKLKLTKKIKLIIISLSVIIVIGLGLIYYGYKNDWFSKETKDKIKEIIEKKPVKKLQVIDLDSKTRPYAVVIDNVKAARPQVGTKDAYLIYEMIVEGGLTRMLALYKDSNVKQIGPVRSARHYFIDYALENDAIFVHFGWSPQAESDISKYKVQNLNGLSNPSNMFWRDSSLHRAPHNVYTSSTNMLTAAGNRKYRTDSKDFKLLNYVVDEFELIDKYPEETDILPATEVRVNYSKSVYSSFTYDAENKVYLKSINGNSHIDAAKNEQLDFKNIIVVTGVANHTIDRATNRQNIKNVGTGNGYYITNGTAIKITWNKTSRSEKTIYTDINGEEIEINDGKTFINIQPEGQKLTIN